MIQTLVEHSLMAVGVIQAESMSVTEKELSSSASIVEEMTGTRREVGTWLRDGKGRVWRISRVEENPVTKTQTLTLESILQVLKDKIIPEELTASGMGGGENCTAAQAIRAILQYQSDFSLGTCEYTDSSPYSFDGEDLLSALQTVLDSLDDPWCEVNVSKYPFKINIRKKNTTPQCEMRMDRNIVSMRRTVDTSGMFTRFYPIGKEDLRLSGKGYKEKNVSKYGLREKMSTDQNRETEAELKSWADEQLRKHARPDVTITISGVDLSADTGEPLDRLVLGTVCRVPLPEFGTVESERIIQLSWPDEINRPEDVTVTLGNEIQDISRVIKNEVTGSSSTAAKSGKASKKKAKEDHAWFVDTTTHVGMVAEAVAGEGASKNWSRVSEVMVDGEGIHQRVTKTEDKIVTHEARIDVAEDRITQEVYDRESGDNGLHSFVEQEAGRIVRTVENLDTKLSTKIQQTDTAVGMSVGTVKYTKTKTYANKNAFPATGSADTLYKAKDTGKYYVWVPGTKSYELAAVDEYGNANYIKAGEIAISFNESGQTEAKLDADRVLAGKGALTIDDLELPDWMDTTTGLIAEKATIVQLNALKARVGTLEADSITTATLASKIANLAGVTIKVLKVNSVEIPAGEGNQLKANAVINAYGGIQDRSGHVYNVYDASVSGNVLTIKKLDGNDVTFSKATSLSGAWSGGVYQVTAKQNGTTVATLNYDPPMRLNGTTAASNFSAEIYEVTGSSTTYRKRIYGYLVSTANGASSYVDVNTESNGTGTSVARLSVGSIYTGGRTDGWNQARGKVRVPGSGSAAFITAQWPGANYNTTENRKYELTDDGDNTVILRYNTAESGQQPNYVTAARYRHGKYEDGYADGKSDYEEVHSNEISAGDPENIGTDSTGYTNIGGIERPASRTYVGFTVTVRGKSKDFCISIN